MTMSSDLMSWPLILVRLWRQAYFKDLRNYNTENFFAGMCLGLASINFVREILEFRLFSEQEVENQKNSEQSNFVIAKRTCLKFV
jgi:hypothetical protein